MPALRIPVMGLLLLVAIAALALLGLREQTPLWSGTLWSLAIALLIAAAISSALARGPRRAFAIGFALAGWTVLAWTWLARDGVFTATPDNQGWPGDPPGSIATKLYWFASVDGLLKVEGERLDAASPPMVVHRVNRGQSSSWRGPTWATPVTFPSEGCWRLTARLGDVSLSYVLEVTRS